MAERLATHFKVDPPPDLERLARFLEELDRNQVTMLVSDDLGTVEHWRSTHLPVSWRQLGFSGVEANAEWASIWGVPPTEES